MSMQDASVIDVPGGTSVEQVDASGAQQASGGFESLAKSSAPADDASIMGFSANQGGAFTPAYETPQMTPSAPAGSPETMARGSVDEQKTPEIIPMAINQVPQPNPEQQVIYKQQQEQVIEERKVQQKQVDDQARKQMQNQQKFVDQQKMARNVVPPQQKPQTPGAKPQQISGKPEDKAAENAEQGEHKSDAPLMEQVKYGSILRRSRSSNQMSEEEEELMKKLGNNEDEPKKEEGEGNSENSETP